MEKSRKVVLFPVGQFYAVVGTINMATDPYSVTLTDICNDMSNATHGARDHVHRHGKIYLTNAEFYDLSDNTQKVCGTLRSIHLALKDIQAVIDFTPERHKGNQGKRKEYGERKVVKGPLQFVLHEHVISGVADPKDIYRRSEQFLGMTEAVVQEAPESKGLSLTGFLEMIGCPLPDYMAVNLANVFHS